MIVQKNRRMHHWILWKYIMCQSKKSPLFELIRNKILFRFYISFPQLPKQKLFRTVVPFFVTGDKRGCLHMFGPPASQKSWDDATASKSKWMWWFETHTHTPMLLGLNVKCAQCFEFFHCSFCRSHAQTCSRHIDDSFFYFFIFNCLNHWNLKNIEWIFFSYLLVFKC